MSATNFSTAIKHSNTDEWYTPAEAVELIVPYLKRREYNKILCPFDKEQSQFVCVLMAHGFEVTYGHVETGQDFCLHNCSYRTNAGYCGMTGGYESCQYIKYLEKLEKEKTNIKPYAGKRTNADRIRRMTDEELAALFKDHFCPMLIGADMDCQNSCEKCWLDWLKQEAKL